jgi:flagellar biosynthesis anti-sigma factor FlgM
MNIRNDLQSILPAGGNEQVASADRASGASSASAPEVAGDQTHLSFAATLVSHTSALAEVRTEKVQSTQAAIADGSYNVNSTDVAQSLMNHMLGHLE